MSPIPIPPEGVEHVIEQWMRDPETRKMVLTRRWYVDAEGVEIDLPIVSVREAWPFMDPGDGPINLRKHPIPPPEAQTLATDEEGKSLTYRIFKE